MESLNLLERFAIRVERLRARFVDDALFSA